MLNIIYEGNLEELKKIPKQEIPHNLIIELEKTLVDIEKLICEYKNNDESKYSLPHFLQQKNNIQSCIIYLNKIK